MKIDYDYMLNHPANRKTIKTIHMRTKSFSIPNYHSNQLMWIYWACFFFWRSIIACTGFTLIRLLNGPWDEVIWKWINTADQKINKVGTCWQRQLYGDISQQISSYLDLLLRTTVCGIIVAHVSNGHLFCHCVIKETKRPLQSIVMEFGVKARLLYKWH